MYTKIISHIMTCIQTKVLICCLQVRTLLSPNRYSNPICHIGINAHSKDSCQINSYDIQVTHQHSNILQEETPPYLGNAP